MSLLPRRPARIEQRFNASAWLEAMTPPTASGVPVSLESALRSSAVAACQRVLVTSAATLPVWAMRKQGRRHINVDPAPSIVGRPSARVTRRNWVAQIMRSLVKDGNAYVELTGFDRREYPTQAEVLPLSDIRWVQHNGVERLYVRNKPADLWPNGNILHIPSSAFMGEGAAYAMSPTAMARESIGVGLAAERFGASFFAGGGHPSAIIASDRELTLDEARAVKAAFRTAIQGQEPAVFGAGLDYKPIQVNPSDTQYLDLMRFETEQVCRFLGVPPSMVYAAISGQSVTYTNATQADLQFLKHNLKIWLDDIEDHWSSLLPAPVTVKFDVDDLLRMDSEARWRTHEVAVRLGARTINEVREAEGEDPFEGEEFDRPLVPGPDFTQLELPV